MRISPEPPSWPLSTKGRGGLIQGSQRAVPRSDPRTAAGPTMSGITFWCRKQVLERHVFGGRGRGPMPATEWGGSPHKASWVASSLGCFCSALSGSHRGDQLQKRKENSNGTYLPALLNLATRKVCTESGKLCKRLVSTKLRSVKKKKPLPEAI